MIKKLIGKIHLILGLSSGLVVCIVALTGALWAFESEISDLIYPYRTVKIENKGFLPPNTLIDKTKHIFRSIPVQNITYLGKNRSATLSYYKEENGYDQHLIVYINPYNAQIMHVAVNEHSFFDIIIDIHVNLMLGKLGRNIVDYATLIFIFMLISGIILWWPKNKSAAKQRFWFMWKQGLKWKRKNYDLHNILGFYSSFIIIFIALTGLAWGFEWIDRAIQNTANLSIEYKTKEETQSVSDTTIRTHSEIENKIYYHSIQQFAKTYEALSLYRPENEKESFRVYINPNQKTWYQTANYSYDQRTGNFLKADIWENRNRGEKVNNLYYDIHIGKILGITGQFIAFFASLIVASLPITGFYIWSGRNNKNQHNF
jgi:uncharacterized iron-regulated membrane protein